MFSIRGNSIINVSSDSGEHGRMDGQTDGWVDGWTGRQMDGSTGRRIDGYIVV